MQHVIILMDSLLYSGMVIVPPAAAAYMYSNERVVQHTSEAYCLLRTQLSNTVQPGCILGGMPRYYFFEILPYMHSPPKIRSRENKDPFFLSGTENFPRFCLCVCLTDLDID